MSLTPAQREILVFEGNPFPDPAGKAQAVSALFGCSMDEYRTLLEQAVDTDGAAAFAHTVVQTTLQEREKRSQRGSTISLFA